MINSCIQQKKGANYINHKNEHMAFFFFFHDHGNVLKTLTARVSFYTPLQQLRSLLLCSTLERIHVARKNLELKKFITSL